MPSYEAYNNLIGGIGVPPAAGKTFSNVNPARQDDILGEFQCLPAPRTSTQR